MNRRISSPIRLSAFLCVLCVSAFFLCLAMRGQVALASVPTNLSALAREPFLYPYVPPMAGPAGVQGPRSKVQGLTAMGSVEHALLVEGDAGPEAGVPVPSVRLSWTVVQPNVDLYEVWHSSNLVDWHIMATTASNWLSIPETNLFLSWMIEAVLVTNADLSVTTNFITVPFTNNADFYKVRAMDVNFEFERTNSNWPCSEWATK